MRPLLFSARARQSALRSLPFRISAPAGALAALCLLGSACQTGSDMAVTGLNPRAGHIAGDQTVEIQGQNFRTDIGYTVYFGKGKAGNVTIRSKEALVVTSPSGQAGPVDVTIRADDGHAFLLKQAFTYEDMGGSVVEGIGKPGTSKDKGNLAF
jgi:IPT/TIG domain